MHDRPARQDRPAMKSPGYTATPDESGWRDMGPAASPIHAKHYLFVGRRPIARRLIVVRGARPTRECRPDPATP
jgi:hypothetical protein